MRPLTHFAILCALLGSHVAKADNEARVLAVTILNTSDLTFYDVPTGDGEQIRPIDLFNPDAIIIQFSKNIPPSFVDASDLQLFSASFGIALPGPTDVVYDPPTKTATWIFASPIDSSAIEIIINADSFTPPRPLDGEWDNPSTIADQDTSIESGDGVPGGDFNFRFSHFSADFDRDGNVDGDDFDTVFANFGLSGATRADGDANGDGFVDFDDFLNWQVQFGLSVHPWPGGP